MLLPNFLLQGALWVLLLLRLHLVHANSSDDTSLVCSFSDEIVPMSFDDAERDVDEEEEEEALGDFYEAFEDDLETTGSVETQHMIQKLLHSRRIYGGHCQFGPVAKTYEDRGKRIEKLPSRSKTSRFYDGNFSSQRQRPSAGPKQNSVAKKMHHFAKRVVSSSKAHSRPNPNSNPNSNSNSNPNPNPRGPNLRLRGRGSGRGRAGIMFQRDPHHLQALVTELGSSGQPLNGIDEDIVSLVTKSTNKQ